MSFMHCSPTYPAIETPHVYTAFQSGRLTRTPPMSLGFEWLTRRSILDETLPEVAVQDAIRIWTHP
jgi:hypothetical protein